MATNEWDLRLAVKAYDGDVDVDMISRTLSCYINSPFFTSKHLADNGVQMLVRRIWWSYMKIDPAEFADDGRAYLTTLMDLASSWRVMSTDYRMTKPEVALLKYNAALIMMAVTEVLQHEDE